MIFTTPASPTDVTANTNAREMWRFLSETRQAIYDLKVKEKLYAEAYLAEMRRATFPAFFNWKLLELAIDRQNGEQWRPFILKEMFGEEFLEKHPVTFTEIMGYNSYVFDQAEGYYICFTCDGCDFQFYAPNPANVTVKDVETLRPLRFSAHWCVHDEGETGRCWNMVNEHGNESYDWKEICENVMLFVERRQRESK